MGPLASWRESRFRRYVTIASSQPTPAGFCRKLHHDPVVVQSTNMTRIDGLFERYRSRGDAAALGRVFDATAGEIVHVARYLVGDEALAEDILQQTFLSAIETADRWDSSRPLTPWLIGIAANHARMARRRAHQRTRSEAPEALHDPTSNEPGPFECARSAELDNELESAFSRLRAPYGDVLRMHLRDDKDTSEIAQELGRSHDTVRSQLRRGLELLRRALPIGAATVVVAAPSLSAARIAKIRTAVMGRATSIKVGFAITWQAVAILVLLFAGTVWLWPSAADPTPTNPEGSTTEIDAARTASTIAMEDKSRERNRVASESPSSADGVRIRVLDENGNPVSGAHLAVLEGGFRPDPNRVAEALADLRANWRRDDPLSGRASRAHVLRDRRTGVAEASLRGVSDSNGHWRLPRPDPSVIRVICASLPDGRRGIMPILLPDFGSVVSDEDIPVVAAESTETIELTVRTPRTLRVSVLDRSGTPVPEIAVVLRAPMLASLTSQWLSVTDADGVATFVGTEELALVTLQGQQIEIDLDYPHNRQPAPSFDPLSPPHKPIVLKLPPTPTGTLSIEVVDDAGTPIPGALVAEISGYSKSPPAPEDQLGSWQIMGIDGIAHLPRVEVGTSFWVRVHTPFGMAETTTAGPTSAGHEAQIKLTIKRPKSYILAGAILAADGTPLSKAIVHAQFDCQLESGAWGSGFEPFTLDEEGRFQITIPQLESQPVSATLEAIVEPSETRSAGITRVSLGRLDFGTIELGTLRCEELSLACAGRVVDDSNNSLDDAILSITVTKNHPEESEISIEEEPVLEESEWSNTAAGQIETLTRENREDESSTPNLLPLNARPPIIEFGRRPFRSNSFEARRMPQTIPIDGFEKVSQGTLQTQRLSWAARAILVPRQRGFFDVYTNEDVSRIRLHAKSARARGEANVECEVGDESVSIVVRARSGIRGSVRLQKGWNYFFIECEVMVTRENGTSPIRALPRKHMIDSRGKIDIGELPAGRASLRVFLRGESEPLLQIDDLVLEAGEACRDERLKMIELPDTVRTFSLKVFTPSGERWSNAAEPGVVYFGPVGSERTSQLRRTQRLDEHTTVFMTSRTALAMHVEVPGLRMAELPHVDGDRRVRLEAGIPIRIVLPSGRPQAHLLLTRCIGRRSERGAPWHTLKSDSIRNGVVETAVPCPGRYEVANYYAPSHRTMYIEVVESSEVQEFGR